jgi:hypothetical protein
MFDMLWPAADSTRQTRASDHSEPHYRTRSAATARTRQTRTSDHSEPITDYLQAIAVEATVWAERKQSLRSWFCNVSCGGTRTHFPTAPPGGTFGATGGFKCTARLVEMN